MSRGIITAKNTFAKSFILSLSLTILCSSLGCLQNAGSDPGALLALLFTPRNSDSILPAPGNNGTLTISRIGGSYLTLTWDYATDNTTKPADLQYAVYASLTGPIASVEAAEGNGTLVKNYTKNVKSHVAIGLLPSTQYHLNVVVRDEAGNKAVYTSTPAETRSWWPSTNGDVRTIITSNSLVYIGGSFTRIARAIPYGQVLDTATGSAPAGMTPPLVNGIVFNMTPDGAGGWYIAGSFTTVYGTPRNYCARINADGSLHDWNPEVNGQVHTLALRGSTVYLGGSFNKIEGTTRYYIGAVDAITGKLKTWNANSSSSIDRLLVRGSRVYAAGVSCLEAYDADYGNKVMDAQPDAAVWDFVLNADGTRIYAAGAFNTIGGSSRKYVAELDSNGTATSLNIVPNDYVYTIAESGGTIYIGGSFTSISGQPRNRLAAIDTNSAILPWNPAPNNHVGTLRISGGIIYAGGGFTAIGGQDRNYVAAIDADGNATSWNPDAHFCVDELAINGTRIFIAGRFTGIGGVPRNRLAAFDSAGNLAAWDPNANNTVNTMVAGEGVIYAGGFFTTIGGQNRNRLAAIDTGGNVTSWNPDANNTLSCMTRSGDTIYVGGAFTVIGGQNRGRIAAIDTAGTVFAWNPNASSSVSTLALSGDIVYAGGSFTTIGGQARNYLAALDSDGNATAWNPGPNNAIKTLATRAGIVYAGGFFTSIGGQARNYLAAIDSNGAATSWNPGPGLYGYVDSILPTAGSIYVGGRFNTIGGQTKHSLAALDYNGIATAWNPDIRHSSNGNLFVGTLALSIDGTSIMSGGYFTESGTETRNGLAIIDIITGEPR